MNPYVQGVLGWLQMESTSTMRMIEAIPADKFGTKVHDRFKAAGELANHLADSWLDLVDSYKEGKAIFNQHVGASDVPATIQRYREGMDKIVATIGDLSEDQLNQKYKMEINGQVVWEPTGIELLQGYICHEIHHRGQLSLLIRLLGGKVPGMYGPSGDNI